MSDSPKFGSSDREPTEDEEQVAESVSKDVDMDSVSQHEKEMEELGANVEGEGKVV